MDITLLTKEQIWGNGNGAGQLDVMKKYGTKVAPTDLTLILGGYITSGDYRTSEGDLTGTSWSASSHSNGRVHGVDIKGAVYWARPNGRSFSARPALPPSEASKITPAVGIHAAEYGEYPQTVADEHTSDKLEKLYEVKSLQTTGKNYTFDAVGLTDYDTSFKATSYPEYEMDGKRYIRVLGRPADDDSKLSTGEQVEEGKPYWVQVLPIEWLMDPSGTMVAKKCLFAGIQFDTKEKYDGDFSKTFMKHYLDTYFAKEMVAERPIDKEHKKIVQNLKEQLAVASDISQKPIGRAKTPERQAKAEELVIARRHAEVMNRITRKILSGGDKDLEEKMAQTTDKAKLSLLYREAYAKLSDDDKKLCAKIGKETGAMMTKAKDTLEKERRFLRTRRKSGQR